MQSFALQRARPFQQRSASGSRAPAVRAMATSLHDFKSTTLEGKPYDFASTKGKVVLITNVACACGLTNSNYKELVRLHDKYHSQGLEIMAFPCNQFGRQESGSPEQIRKFVTDKYKVAFNMMERVEVNGPNTDPIFKHLKSACATCDGDIDWNFRGKFLVDKEGTVVLRSGDNPMALEGKIKELLAA